ncbi:MAG TPA: PEP-CTERM sorting domain-containing protein [Kiritimatiellia bacterium]|nr:PEP-CTERM sorting domain-containing protein [Kiritimatiellia bacterium]
MRKLIVFALVAMMAGSTFAAWGFWDADRSWVIIDSGSGDVGYSLWDSAAGTFQNNDFGSFDVDTDTFVLSGYDTKVWKDGGSDVNGVEYFYTIYSGSRPETPTFSSLGGGWMSDTPFQVWGNAAADVNLLSGLSAGQTYTLEIYGQITGTDDGNPANNYNLYDNNGGAPANYTATFATIPEPATFGLLAIGAGLMYLRKRYRA